MEYGKKFLIIGNINCITYKEVFPLIQQNKVWLGPSIVSGDRKFFVPDDAPYFEHNYEGPDDMAAHAKCIITGASINIPITNGKLNLGTWQGIYLCEFRNEGGGRHVVATII